MVISSLLWVKDFAQGLNKRASLLWNAIRDMARNGGSGNQEVGMVWHCASLGLFLLGIVVRLHTLVFFVPPARVQEEEFWFPTQGRAVFGQKWVPQVLI